MKPPKAFLFDLNGTMVNDMPFHIRAWHNIFHQHGKMFSLEESKRECYGKNEEILDRIFPGKFTQEEKDLISITKEKKYQHDFLPHLKLIDGLDEYLKKADAAGIKMAIGSAAILFNVDFVLDGLNIRNYFGALVSADDVVKSKPDAETFLKGAAALNVDPKNCIVFEDAPKGVEAALNANMKCVVITTMHTKEEFAADANIIGFIEDYNDDILKQLLN